jgi:D-beta-D-heptose 7-phosphate kinase/D-beta-D-heptose 1-phosphate adenosyltransferase
MSRVVFTNGVFDILHPGHYNLLTTCRTYAGRYGKVYVGIDTDEKVKKDKGENRPINSYWPRMQNLISLKYPLDSLLVNLVDQVHVFGSNEELYELIKKYKPDIIVKGADWKGNVVGSDLAEVVLYNKQTDDKGIACSTTDIETKILRLNKPTRSFNPNI